MITDASAGAEGTPSRSVSSPGARSAIGALALALLLFVFAWTGRAAEGRRLLEASASAFERGDRVEAIVLARAAAQARCPACSAPELAYAQLDAISKDAEARGDDVTAVAAWRAVRAATLATSVLDTSPARRVRADQEIARLEHRIDAAAAATEGTASPAASEEKLRGALATSTVPSGAVFAFLALGGALLILGSFRFARASTFQATSLVLALVGGALAAAGVLLF